jgi:hypothetical protein
MKASIKARLDCLSMKNSKPVRVVLTTEEDLAAVEAEMRFSGELANDNQKVRIIVLTAPRRLEERPMQ